MTRSRGSRPCQHTRKGGTAAFFATVSETHVLSCVKIARTCGLRSCSTTGASRRQHEASQRPHRATRRGRPVRLAAIGLVWLGVGCFSPEVSSPECIRSCSECPPNWACSTDGYCVRPGFEGACSTGTGGSPSLAPPSVGGASIARPLPTPAGSPTLGDAGAGGHDGSQGGAAGESGAPEAAGAPSLEPVELHSGAEPFAGCSGQDVSRSLRVTGGVPPYVWDLSANDCAVALESEDGQTNVLRGAPPQAGTCEIIVGVTAGDQTRVEARLSLEVSEAPRVTTEILPPACASQEVSFPLMAEGGDSSRYTFQVETEAAGDWHATDGALVGVVPADGGTLEVTVHDTVCASEPRSLELAVAGTDCARLATIQQQAGLPPPCAGQPYDVVIEASQKVAAWEVLSTPPGLSFAPDEQDASKAILSGSANWEAHEGALFSARLTLEDGRTFLSSHSLVARQSCWLAYVSRQDGPWQLHLYDPALEVHRTFAPSAEAAVVDFAFSPDGKFAVYRAQAAGERAFLTLLSMSDLTQQTLEFDGGVVQYAWAPAGNLLAVALQRTADQVVLASAAISRAAPLPSSGAVKLSYLPGPAADVRSELQWLGDHGVAYLVPSEVIGFALERAPHGAGGFLTPSASSPSYVAPVVLQTFPNGTTAVSSLNAFDIYPIAPIQGTARFVHFERTALSPSGRFVADNPPAKDLVIYGAAEPEDAARAQLPNVCGALLAWANDTERLACVTTTDQGGEVRIFDFDESTNDLSHSLTALGDYTFSPNIASGRRRIFSPSGDLFAFTTAEQTYLTDLSRNGRAFWDYPVLQRIGNDEPNLDADLRFSPDERFLVEHRGANIILYDTESADTHGLRLNHSASLRQPGACSESYMEAASNWCGAARQSNTEFVWSPSSVFVAFRLADHQLQINKLTPATEFGSVIVNAECGSDCLKQFSFQP